MLEKSQESEDMGEEAGPLKDLGSQLEDLFIHALKCARWAELDDRIDLSLRIRRPRQAH